MSSQDDKNEPSRFLGEGVSFKAKLIGILEVSEARGDRMCQEALADLKMAIRAAGEHKQRITINIAIDGLRLRDEKTGDSLYHHPVHKISFIAQDMSDSRAFGYIFGSPDTGHRFFGIKTDKAASQVVFELKKKEIELAKQHIEQKNRFGSSNTGSSAAAAAATASLFSDSIVSSTKSYQNGDSQHTSSKLTSVSETSKSQASGNEGAVARGGGPNESAIADLVDLELELSSIQQGIHQMERITPSDPFGPSKDDPFSSDPFGDSFTSFPQKPFLPPPPSSRERQSRTASDTSGSLFSPKTPKTGGSIETSSQETNLFKTSHDEPSSCDWFTPTGGADSLFEDGPTSAVSTEAAGGKDTAADTAGTSSLKESNASILSQFDVFTELDPLGTGRSKPYIDKKLFFQELKNPPKKVLKDLVTETQPAEASLFTANFETNNTHTTTTTIITNNNTNTSFTNNSSAVAGHALFQTDPFADDDPFDKTDPFAEDEFTKAAAAAADPFDTDFVGEFKLFNKPDLSSKPLNIKSSESIEAESTKFKFPSLTHANDKLQPLFPSPLSKSPNRSGMFDKQMSLSSPRTTSSSSTTLGKQNMFDSDKRSYGKLTQLHENPSLDMSSESECAPEPPPRPATNITPIKPPPLPPKKQAGDLAVKPPPRPPHSEESHYDYMESYETGLNSLDGLESLEPTPPLPVPARKSRFDSSDYGFAPQRPKKQFQGQSSDEDYLTPIAPPLLPPQKKTNFSKDSAGPILLPPPMKKDSKRTTDRLANQVTVASFLESKPKLTSTIATDKLNLTPDTLDITLSQLTLSGLNELANKLNIPASQLSNMTLVQLTSYLSNYVKSNNTTEAPSTDATFPTFKADFSANFNDLNNTTAKSEPYDRYAVFRELLQQEENKPNETAPLESKEVSPKSEEEEEEPQIPELEENKENIEFKSTFDESTTDRYAALREIILETSKISEEKETNLEPIEDLEEEKPEEELDEGLNNLNQESLKTKEDTDDKLNREVESNIIEYESSLEANKDKLKSSPPVKSPIKSPVPVAITEIIHQTSNHLTSGSVSDVVSGSSPEIDNAGSNSEAVSKKNVENTARESWAIFDTPNHRPESKEKQVQSEEGVSPWSSDSKEFGNGSPSDWQQRRDSGSEGDWSRRRRDASWWDTQGEVGGHYEKPSRSGYARERRSTDSYDDEWYEPDRPRRRRQQPSTHTWNKNAAGAGGQSSSSRDVSPWEEEEPRGTRREECWPSCRRSRGPSWDRHRRREDSWDEEDDYDYEDEYVGKFHWPERHGSRDSDRASRDSDRHTAPRGEPPDHWDSGGDQWTEERRHVRRRAHPQDDRWCRPDWDHDSDIVCGTKEKIRYGGSRWQNQDGKWRGDRERKRDSDRYYKRDHSQESPWEDDYSNDPDEPHSPRYLSARRNWKRPSSASEMDRKSGEIKSRAPYYMGTGGSDGERDRKYRANRRSRSRDSQFTEMPHQRHKPDTSLTLGRYSHRTREKIYGQKFESDYAAPDKLEVKLEKKSATLGRKKAKELPSPKVENETIAGKVLRKTHLMFENDFVNSETDSPVATKTKFNFENDFETSEAESPVSRYSRSPRGQSDTSDHFQSKRNLRVKQTSIGFENDFSKDHGKSSRESGSKSVSPSMQMSMKQKSLFEDDFSPTEKTSTPTANVEDSGITVIAEETVSEPRVSFTENKDKATPSEIRKSSKYILAKNRIANNIRGDGNIKKSESINIFARENDPFDDDFFSGRDSVEIQKVENSKVSPNNVVTEFKWTEDFDTFDIPEENDK